MSNATTTTRGGHNISIHIMVRNNTRATSRSDGTDSSPNCVRSCINNDEYNEEEEEDDLKSLMMGKLVAVDEHDNNDADDMDCSPKEEYEVDIKDHEVLVLSASSSSSYGDNRSSNRGKSMQT